MGLYEMVKEKRNEKKKLAEDAGKILVDANGTLNAEQREVFEKHHKRIDELSGEIDVLERQMDRESELRGSAGVLAGRDDSDPNAGDPVIVTPEQALLQDRKSFVDWARGGMMNLTPEMRKRQQNLHRQFGQEMRALSAITDAAGAYTIAEGFYPVLIDAQKAFGGMLGGVCTEFTTSTGAPLPIATDDDTSNEGEVLGENTAAALQDPSFGQVTLGSYTISSKMVKVPIQLLQDTEFNLESWLFGKLGERMGRRKNRMFTVGTGSNESQGIIPAATVGKTTAAAGVVTYLEMLALKHSVDPAYRVNNPMWMFNDNTLLALKSLLDSQNRPLWQTNAQVREPDTLDGDRYVINQSMVDITNSSKSILYGDLKHYFIRNVSGAVVMALRERYAEALQVAFLAFSRHDGVLVDAGTHPVKVMQQHS